MEIKHNLTQIFSESAHNKQASVLTIGNFDGVHLGHAKILAEVEKIAQEKKLLPTVITFEPHPACFFKPDLTRDFRIKSLSQKLKILRDKKISQTIILPFKRELSELSARDFVKKILVEALNIRELVIGYDFIFGKNREGNLQLLQELAKHYGFNITNISAQKNGEQIYSSSLIRLLIKEGKINEANQALGHNFSINGTINSGKKLGRTIGFPTANLKAKPHIIQPRFGVYEVLVTLDNKTKKGIMNFGLKPTVGGVFEPLYEIHIFNFAQEIYGKKINVELINFIREEKKFSSIEELKEQIQLDIDSIR